MAREAAQETFAAAWSDGGVVVDVREPHEYATGHVPGARLMPLRTVAVRCGELPADRPVYVICASGNRSRTAADLMTSRGIDAYSVIGGTGAWARSGHPIAAGSREPAA
ncbi:MULTISPECIES: rhodanese-like domain-containing protein [Streptomyces]|uniref:rhodanese-like domain-containing protein n=1 Tax=Streptomyces TaxID=1883 RepID=UPI0004CA43B8|nr:rhodanese-like domain-containing protein [Streptomyces sp. KS_5]SEE70973.1 Rhodanese-related sulfurtransferase [Streptomyces sp. KS_5]